MLASLSFFGLYYFLLSLFCLCNSKGVIPNYSSFKLGGVQLRGKNAATLQLLFLTLSLFVNIFKLLWRISIAVVWFIVLAIKWLVDFLIGFYRGYSFDSSTT